MLWLALFCMAGVGLGTYCMVVKPLLLGYAFSTSPLSGTHWELTQVWICLSVYGWVSWLSILYCIFFWNLLGFAELILGDSDTSNNLQIHQPLHKLLSKIICASCPGHSFCMQSPCYLLGYVPGGNWFVDLAGCESGMQYKRQRGVPATEDLTHRKGGSIDPLGGVWSNHWSRLMRLSSLSPEMPAFMHR